MIYLKSYLNAFWQLFKLGSAIYVGFALIPGTLDATYLAFACALVALGGPIGVMIDLESDE